MYLPCRFGRAFLRLDFSLGNLPFLGVGLVSWKRNDGVVGGGDFHLEVVADLVKMFGDGDTFGGAAVAAGAWDSD